MTTLRDELLERYTGIDSAGWVERMQLAISASFRDSPDANHPFTDVHKWMRQIADAIADCVETDQQEYDENIRAATIAALVFATWASRIAHAKSYDPARPLEGRLASLDRHRQQVAAIVEAAVDESRDGDYFPTQEWNPPYGLSARGGTFV